jgi:lysophospholipid acyltransferase (LPLAT)-like uncharacterized protein
MPEVQNPKPPPVAPNRKSGVVIPHAPKCRQRLAAELIYALTHALAATLRFRLNDLSGYFSDVPQEKIIFAIWHNRLALALILYRRYVARRDHSRRLVAMVSASRDGGMLAGVLERFGVEPVRGSSSRRGPQALREMVSWGRRGHDLAITPDGPRGPRYVAQEGVLALAQVTGLPIIPASYYLGWKVQAKSWDRLQIPLPFSVCEVMIGKPVRIPREASDEERETLRQQLEQTLREISRD